MKGWTLEREGVELYWTGMERWGKGYCLKVEELAWSVGLLVYGSKRKGHVWVLDVWPGSVYAASSQA